MIRAVLVDDEINMRENLNYLLKNFTKEIKVIGEAGGVDEAIKVIETEKPDLVFLDIEMPNKNGFQLLKAYDKIPFQVIFVTAYDSYAIKAFQVAALDYLLKPIDVGLLQKSIIKVQEQLAHKDIKERLNLLKHNTKKIKQIAIPYKTDYVILAIEKILCIEADRMYVNIFTTDDKKYVIAKKLSYYERLFEEESNLIRIHRSWMVNLKKIKSYSKKEKEIILNTGKKIPVSQTYKIGFESLLYT